MDTNLEILADTVRSAVADRRALRIRGGGTKDFYGQTLTGDLLDTRSYTGIVDYDPTELVITARCGTPLKTIDAALAAQGQMLAFEPPHFGEGATLGGCIAAGLSGPRRQAAGALRDFVLGATLMNHRGEVLRFGGRVMKNVAGYDVSRLLAGSLGTLGLIVDVSLKVLPKPAVDLTLSSTVDEATALRKLNEWSGKPLPISASAWRGGVLKLRLSGTGSAVETAAARLSNELSWTRVDAEAAARFWIGIREHTDSFFGGATALWRLSIPSTAPALGLGDEQLIEWGGALRWLRTGIDATTVRAAIERTGGHATLFRGVDKSAGVFHPLPNALRKIHIALKTEFDGAGVFNRDRMYGDF
ncbi:MAG TPA: glycolate oxidase subunit GlcE [Burkholderiales bacterium]|nr:glycolate oxidase subunit GlcE [Burkholderiales bacterium]